MIRTLAVAALSLLAQAGKHKGPLPGQGIDWHGDWDVAIKEATARNVPMLFYAAQDGSAQCKAMAESTWTDRKVIDASRNFVCIVGDQTTGHGANEVILGREKVKLCSQYYTIPCEKHVEGSKVAGRFFQGQYTVPITVFAEPGGKELFNKQASLNAGDMVKQMNDALSKVTGEKVPLPAWQAAKQLVKDAEAALEKKDGKKAVDAYTKIGKLSRSPWFKDTSRDGLDKVNTEGEKLLQDALALGTAAEKKKALQTIADDFKPLRVSAQAKKELDALK